MMFKAHKDTVEGEGMSTPFLAIDLDAEVVTRCARLAVVCWSGWPDPDSDPECMGQEDCHAGGADDMHAWFSRVHTSACFRCLFPSCCLLIDVIVCLTGCVQKLIP